MLRQTFVFLLVALEVLLLSTLHTTGNDERSLLTPVSLLFHILAFQHTERLVVSDDLRVDGVVGRTAEGQIVDGIQDIGLAHTVAPDETIHLGRQLQLGLANVLIVQYG